MPRNDSKGWVFVDIDDDDQIDAVGGRKNLQRLVDIGNASVRPRQVGVWEWLDTARDLMRSDELELVIERVKELKEWEVDFYDEVTGEEMTAKRIWLKAIDAATDVLYERMDHLWSRHG